MGVKRKGPWRSLGGCCQELRSVCVRGAELLPCALADKDALGHRLRAMGASFYLSRSPLAALRLRPLGQFRTELLPPPRLAAPSATADRARRAPSLNRPGARAIQCPAFMVRPVIVDCHVDVVSAVHQMQHGTQRPLKPRTLGRALIGALP